RYTPGAPQIRGNGRDENCSATDECDADGDGHDTERPLRTSYAAITHWISNDCNDTDPTVYAGAPEIPCDGVDQNCDGVDNCDKDDRGVRLACRADRPPVLG